MNSDRLDIYLDLHSSPLTQMRHDDNWWHLGPISVSRKHATFTAGYGHPINAQTKLYTQPFDVRGHSGVAIILNSGGKPEEYFVGWVASKDEAMARQWVEHLNGEIGRRVSEDSGNARAEPDTIPQSVTFEQGHEFAPDSPWGYQRVRIDTNGRLEYDHKDRGKHDVVRGEIAPARVDEVLASLQQTSFPTPPSTSFPPGSSVIVLTVEPPTRRMLIDYFVGIKLPGYRDVIAILAGLNDALREGKADILASWGFSRLQ